MAVLMSRSEQYMKTLFLKPLTSTLTCYTFALYQSHKNMFLLWVTLFIGHIPQNVIHWTYSKKVIKNEKR